MMVKLAFLFFSYLHHALTLEITVTSNSLEVSTGSLHDALGNSSDFGWRIWRGNYINIEEAPYTVLYGWFCGGALIRFRWVITAAHCDEEFFVHAGSDIREMNKPYAVDRHMYHPNFTRTHNNYDYDVLLLQIEPFVPETDTSKSIALGTITDLNPGQTVFINGWGHDFYVFNLTKEKSFMSNKLRQVRMTVLDHADCQTRALPHYANKFGEEKTLTERMECAESNEGAPCFGDEGGPVVANNRLVGVVSWGIHCEPLVVFTNLIPLQDWILKTVGRNYTH